VAHCACDADWAVFALAHRLSRRTSLDRQGFSLTRLGEWLSADRERRNKTRARLLYQYLMTATQAFDRLRLNRRLPQTARRGRIPWRGRVRCRARGAARPGRPRLPRPTTILPRLARLPSLPPGMRATTHNMACSPAYLLTTLSISMFHYLYTAENLPACSYHLVTLRRYSPGQYTLFHHIDRRRGRRGDTRYLSL